MIARFMRIALGIILIWLVQPLTTFAQLSVTDLSEELWQKFPLPKAYFVIDCQFVRQIDQPNSWWGCKVHIPDGDGRDAGLSQIDVPNIELVSINEKGDLGGNQRIDLKDKDGERESLLAIGMKNSLLIQTFDQKSDAFLVSALEFLPGTPAGLLTLPVKWQQNLPLRTPNSYAIIFPSEDPIATEDGGYVVLIREENAEAYASNRDWFSLIRLTGDGQKAWQYIDEKNFLAVTDKNSLPSLGWRDRKMMIFGKDKIAVYGYFDETSGKNGTTLLCLNAEGNEVSRQLFKGYYWYKAIPWFQAGFAMIRYVYDEAGAISNPILSLFDDDCHKIADQSLILPDHGLKGTFANHVKTAAIAPNGNLLMVYQQNQTGFEADESQEFLPSLYLAELDAQGLLVCEVPLITSTDENSAYVQLSYTTYSIDKYDTEKYEYEEAKYNFLKVDLLFLKEISSVLVSVYNKGVRYEGLDVAPIHLFPKMYKVKLPCEAEIAQNFKTVDER